MSSDSELEFTSKSKSQAKSKKGKGQAQVPGQNAKKQKGKTKNSPKSNTNGEVREDNVAPTLKNDAQVAFLQQPCNSNLNASMDLEERELGTADSEEDEVDDGSDYSSSSDDGPGRLALGMDPRELGDYDGTTEPQNGSQYLFKVMKELRRTPKVKVGKIREIRNREGLKPSVKYMEKFIKEPVNMDLREVSKFLPSEEMRQRNLQDFSLLRSKIERWRELLSKRVTRLKADSVKFPDAGNKIVWQKFCFGKGFEALLAKKEKPATVEEIVSTYFMDLKEAGRGSIIKKKEMNDLDANPLSPGSITTADDVVAAASASRSTQNGPASVEESSAMETDSSEGCQPLMSVMLVLSQPQIESLLFYQADWITRFGFINKCQGEWLYALLACVDKPVEPSTMGDIRNVCKSLISTRTKFCVKVGEMEQEQEQGGSTKIKSEPPELSEPSQNEELEKLSDELQKELSFEKGLWSQIEEFVDSLNLLIYLIGDYFCQKDLVEEEVL